MKDLADQIRTVHLVLVLVAFVLLATSLQEPTRKIEHSLADARAIYTLATTQQPFAGPVEEVMRSAEEYVAHSGQELQRGEPVIIEITWPNGAKQTVSLAGPLGAAYLSDARYEGEDDIDNPAYSYIPFNVRSLSDFIRFWDHNETEQMVIVPKISSKNIVSLWREEGLGRVGARSFRFLPADAKADKYIQLHAGVEGDSLKFYTYPDAGEPAVTIAVRLTRIPGVSIQPVFIRHANKEGIWLPGKFGSSFPELSDTAKNLKTLDLGDLVTELNDEANRQQDKIELLGAKLDPVVLTRWGLVIVAICQFYLWLHLSALLESVATSTFDSFSANWIGLYPGFWAGSFTLVSLLLPSIIAVYWLFRQWGALGVQWQVVTCLNALVCLVLGVTTVKTLLAVRNELAPVPCRGTRK